MTKKILTKVSISTIILVLLAGAIFAGGWKKSKGLQKMTLTGELVCVGCSLKKMDGANAQCSLYSQHAIGFKTGDGTLWSIVDNQKGHDITRAHTLLSHKMATITGWIFPAAHFIEIDSIKVKGISKKRIAKASWLEDQMLAKRLLKRKVGQAPKTAHKH